MLENAYLIPLLPFCAAVVILFFGRWLPLQGAWLGIAAALYGLAHSVGLASGIYTGALVLPQEGFGGRFFESSVSWFSTGLFRVEAGLLIDGMSAMMLVVVTLVSFLVQVYSLGYQHGKPRFGRYYAYLSMFTAAMLLFVVANNFFQAFVGWELVGVCSYLLIGFEFERPAAAYAGRKAFITTRVGDLGLYVGLLLLLSSVGTFNFSILEKEHVQAGLISPGLACAISLLLFCGAIGKSAQLPLHVWLPDAMEGPTPVSALIHAATMVAAGVFLVARVHFLFAVSETALTVVAWVGGLTALVAALNALVANDIKRVLAFSTVSQLGYMMLSMGVNDPHAGMFHLTTHAFFKALMFLGAGSVIHAVHTNDIWRMGGLSKKMPITFVTFLCGTLAIIGFPMFAGFFSKEAILAAVLAQHNMPLFAIAGFTALLTAFYMCRMFFLTFLGDPRDPHLFAHAHEGGASMTLPLSVLAILAVASGFFFTFVWPFHHWVPAPPGEHHGAGLALGVSLASLVIGAGLAWSMYRRKQPDPAALAREWPRVHAFLHARIADEIYLKGIERFIYAPARAMSRFDYDVLDQAVVDGFAWASNKVSRFKRWFDDVILDGLLVNGAGYAVQTFGAGVRLLQTGFAQFYLLVIAFGLSLLILWAVRAFG
jgi:NADH-quinone oxidoreductase subunit L